ncbi:MAG: PH domain-containing protein [Ferruginibacter sp.]
MIYKTSLGNWTKAITLAVTMLFAFIIIQQYSLITDQGTPNPIYTTVLLLTIYFIAFAFRPVYYKMSNDSLIIHRLIKDVIIERKSIKSIELIDRADIGWAVRTFGVGGLFGYYGNFVNAKMGRMTWYATRRDRTVLVITNNDKKIVLTPDDPQKLIADFYK